MSEEQEFERGTGIYLTLSGGGFRAAAFHLGGLQVLEEVGLLEQLHLLSTVSGGTLLGLRWLKSRVDGESFEEFDASMRSFLTDTHVLREALAGLEDRKLIQAAAAVYASDSFLGDMRFGELEVLHDDGLGEVVVNSTEFINGTDFRFVSTRAPYITVGKRGMTISKSHLAEARLADVAAASSCFPGVFEPVVFPTDFVWDEGLELADAIDAEDVDEVPLMDGGIHDNQGFSAVMRVADRKDPPRPEFAIFSDVALTGLEQLRKEHAEPWYETNRRVEFLAFLLARFLPALGVGLVVLAGVCGYFDQWAATAILVVLTAILFVVHSYITRKLAGIGEKVESASSLSTREIMGAFSSMSLNRLQVLLRLRLYSLGELFGTVFMNRIRSQGYASVYSRLYRRLPGILIIGQQIGDLLDNDIFEARHGQMTPALAEHLKLANEVRTTLWFDSPEELEALIHCGRATMAHNLLDSLRPDDPRHEAVAAIIDEYVEGERKQVLSA